jgi:hypothetical protein
MDQIIDIAAMPYDEAVNWLKENTRWGSDAILLYVGIAQGLFESDVIVEEIGGDAQKHLPGQHDQSSHGSWASGGPAAGNANSAQAREKIFSLLEGSYAEYRKSKSKLDQLQSAYRQAYMNWDKSSFEVSEALEKAKKEHDAEKAKWWDLTDAAREVIKSDQPANPTAEFGREWTEEEGWNDFTEYTKSYINDQILPEIGAMAPILKDAKITIFPSHGRPRFDPGDNAIHVSALKLEHDQDGLSKDLMAKHIAHELGHWIEFNVPEAMERSYHFLIGRSDGKISQDPFTGESYYGGNFISSYTSKFYPGSKFTEILSTGLAYLFTAPQKLALEDPEMFDLVLSIVQDIPEAGTREKHLPGQHDQSSHGSWARGGQDRYAPDGDAAEDIPLFERAIRNERAARASSSGRTASGVRESFVSKLKPEYDQLAAMDAKTRAMAKQARETRERLGRGYHREFWDLQHELRAHKRERTKLQKRINKLEDEARQELEAETPATFNPVYKFRGKYIDQVDISGGHINLKVVEGEHDYSQDLSDYTRGFIESELNEIGKIAAVYGSSDIRVGESPAGRAYYSTKGDALHITNVSPYNVRNAKLIRGQLAHELGHWIENHSNNLWGRAKNFLEKRTAGKKITEYKGRDTELIIKDKFIEGYIGKIYQDGATEIISMGLEYLFNNPYKLATGDPEMFDLVLSIVQGIPE